jgi:hypothetical protein
MVFGGECASVGKRKSSQTSRVATPEAAENKEQSNREHERK